MGVGYGEAAVPALAFAIGAGRFLRVSIGELTPRRWRAFMTARVALPVGQKYLCAPGIWLPLPPGT